MSNATSRHTRMSMISQWILPLALAMTAVPSVPQAAGAPSPATQAAHEVAENARPRRRRPPVDEGCLVLPEVVEAVSVPVQTSCSLAPGPTP